MLDITQTADLTKGMSETQSGLTDTYQPEFGLIQLCSGDIDPDYAGEPFQVHKEVSDNVPATSDPETLVDLPI